MLKQFNSWRRMDHGLTLMVLTLLIFGLVVIGSATRFSLSDPATQFFVRRQGLWVLVSLVAFFLAAVLDYHWLREYHQIFFGLMIGLLASVFVLGGSDGVQRWIDVGPVSFQPSEFAKILLVVVLAERLARNRGKMEQWRDLIVPAVYTALPTLLVLAQPDLGTSIVFLVILFGTLVVAGFSIWRLLFLAGGGLGSVTAWIVLHLTYGVPLPLEEYQLNRILVFIDPEAERFHNAEAYQLQQSKIAIGSGQVHGQGLGSGSQSGLHFLPEQHTDFIFAVLGEELGFIGVVLALALLFGLLLRCLSIAARARDLFGALLVAGVTCQLAFHVLVNVGMTLGVMPVTGLPLPFFSYGGSSLVTTMIGLGLVQNVFIHRRTIRF